MGYQRPPERAPDSAAELFALLCERNFIYNAVTVRRAAVEEVGPPDARLRSMIDWEWWLRLTAAGHRAVRVPGRLAVYRLRPASLSRDPAQVLRGQRDLWRLVAAEYDLEPERRAELAARAARFDAELAAPRGRRPAALARSAGCAGAMGPRLALRRVRDYYAEPPAEVLERRSATCGGSSLRRARVARRITRPRPTRPMPASATSPSSRPVNGSSLPPLSIRTLLDLTSQALRVAARVVAVG